MKVSDIPYMNLGGEDYRPDREHVFHVEIPKEWKTSDLVHLFSSYGGVNVFWVNDTSVFVSLKERTFSSSVLEDLKKNNAIKISSYESYLKKLQREKEMTMTLTLPQASSRPSDLSNRLAP